MFRLYIDRNFLVIFLFGIKISIKLAKIEEYKSKMLPEHHYKMKSYNSSKKQIAIIRLDAIGDYILFRPFLKAIREEYKDFNITYIGSSFYKDILLEFDSIYIDEYIFLNPNTDNSSTFSSLEYDVVISSVYSRKNELDKMISKIKSKEKIGFYGDTTNITSADKIINNKEYTKLIRYSKEFDFEFNINKYFFETLFNKKLDINNTKFLLKDDAFNNIKFNFNEEYIIIFPSANKSVRRWSTKYFSEICKFLYEKYKYTIYVSGSKNDKDIAKNIIGNKKYIKSICGDFKLDELVYIFNKAKLIISGDTMAYHMAVASDTENIICISNGNTYTRFVKYPDTLFDHKKIAQILPKSMSSIDNFDYEYYSTLDINEIKPSDVIEKIEEMLI